MKKEVRTIKRKRRKLNIQKIFNLVSFTFILTCCIFYGSRFIKLYLENNKKNDVSTLATTIIKENKENKNFKEINREYYFKGKENDNYLSYSNLLWRIMRINSDKSITLALENSITSLAVGDSKSFEESQLNSWLNNQDKDYTGILEKNLNDTQKYLTYTKTCNDEIDNIKKITCKKMTDKTYITVPSLEDYVNTGAANSFLNNDEYFYLTNTNSSKEIYYVDENGKLNNSDGNNIIGIKPVITIKNTIEKIDGNGSKDNPYTIEKEKALFGGYVKLDNDIWRIYNIDGDNVKLSLNSYIKINNEVVTYQYSNSGYYHNDTAYGSLAYYLKNNYLNNLSYKNIINEVKFSNGIYSNTDNYDYIETLNTKVDTKVAALSIGDIYLNNTNTDYYTSTGLSKSSNLVYTMKNNFEVTTKPAVSELKIVPTISIKKELLTKGSGTEKEPYEVD